MFAASGGGGCVGKAPGIRPWAAAQEGGVWIDDFRGSAAGVWWCVWSSDKLHP